MRERETRPAIMMRERAKKDNPQQSRMKKDRATGLIRKAGVDWRVDLVWSSFPFVWSCGLTGIGLARSIKWASFAIKSFQTNAKLFRHRLQTSFNVIKKVKTNPWIAKREHGVISCCRLSARLRGQKEREREQNKSDIRHCCCRSKDDQSIESGEFDEQIVSAQPWTAGTKSKALKKGKGKKKTLQTRMLTRRRHNEQNEAEKIKIIDRLWQSLETNRKMIEKRRRRQKDGKKDRLTEFLTELIIASSVTIFSMVQAAPCHHGWTRFTS